MPVARAFRWSILTVSLAASAALTLGGCMQTAGPVAYVQPRPDLDAIRSMLECVPPSNPSLPSCQPSPAVVGGARMGAQGPSSGVYDQAERHLQHDGARPRQGARQSSWQQSLAFRALMLQCTVNLLHSWSG